MNAILHFGSTDSNVLSGLRELYRNPANTQFFSMTMEAIKNTIDYVGKDIFADLVGSEFDLINLMHQTKTMTKNDEHSLITKTIGHIHHLCLIYNYQILENKISENYNCVGAVGHSLGLQSAIISSLENDDMYDILDICSKSIKYIFLTLFRTHQIYQDLKIKNMSNTFQPQDQYSMYSIANIRLDDLESMVQDYNKSEFMFPLEISLQNSTNNFVLSGFPVDLRRFIQKYNLVLEQFGAKCAPINCTAPFHSGLLDPALLLFKKDENFIDLKINGGDLSFPVFATNKFYNLQECGNIYTEVFDQMACKKLNWYSTIKNIVEVTSSDCFIDFGPGMTTRYFTKECLHKLNHAGNFVSISQLKKKELALAS